MSWHFVFKDISGGRYLYFREKARTPRGPRTIRTIYIGTAETHLPKLSSRGEPLKSFDFGKLAALLHAARETGLLDALALRVPHSSFDNFSVATLPFLQVTGRVERPLSREEMAEWLLDSALPFLLPSVGHPPQGPSFATSSASTVTARRRSGGVACSLVRWSIRSRQPSFVRW